MYKRSGGGLIYVFDWLNEREKQKKTFIYSTYNKMFVYSVELDTMDQKYIYTFSILPQ